MLVTDKERGFTNKAKGDNTNFRSKMLKDVYATSVIIPVYNEEAIIDHTLSEVTSFAASNPDFYFLFIDDGSIDNSAEIIKNAIMGISNIGLIENKKNVGKAGALKTAVGYLDTDYVCFTDGDMAYSLTHLHGLVEALKKHDVAIGSRRLTDNKQPNSIKRAVAGEAFNRLARMLLRLPYKDTQAGIKGFRKEAAKKLFSLSRVNNFSFDAELLYIAKLKGYTVGQIPAKVNESHQALPSTIKVLRDSPGMFLSLISIVFYRIVGKYNE